MFTYVMWNRERDLTVKKLYFGLIGHFCRKFNFFHGLTAWICIPREKFGHFTIFCRIFG